MVVGTVISALGTEHLKRQSAHVNVRTGSRGDDWHRRCDQLSCDCVPSGVGVTLATLPHFFDRYPTGQSDEAADVVVVGVGGNNQAQVIDAILIHCLPEQARIGPAIHQDGLAVG